MRDKILCGDVLETLKTLPDGLVDCVVTSPPYWGLRDYGVPGQLGLEPTIEEYLSKMTAVFREVQRVLKDEGTLWLNMGDGYAQASGKRVDVYDDREELSGGVSSWKGGSRAANTASDILKPKDLIGQPWRLAFALQADGWYLRSDIIWAKPNPMPESVTDRPTKSHEYVFLMSKKARYFYDADAVREEGTYDDGGIGGPHFDNSTKNKERIMTDYSQPPAGRNKRTVWTIATQPYPEAHFATFPEKLVEPCIRAGTSEKGYCAECGKPWFRVVERGELKGNDRGGNYKNRDIDNGVKINYGTPGLAHESKTIGWQPSCACDSAPTLPGIVLDPFMGSGTVALVAKKLNRDFLGIELNPKYVKLAEKRLYEEMALFI